ncbi:hypothetical protein DPX16_9212 [Anabarilius grahami]|uniref:Uncharacterized protein n=1 Tax=Anabarilius grahami TaxID=495550 RepID=A0A3N0Y6Z2_ANAGA|nr:hypothetical protein DPX16_9212 [Anabarilius grahami]
MASVSLKLPLGSIFRKHGVSFHGYAGDMQIYVPVTRNNKSAIYTLSACLDEVKSWLSKNFFFYIAQFLYPDYYPNVTVNNHESSRLDRSEPRVLDSHQNRRTDAGPRREWQSESALPERCGEPVRRLQTVKHMTSPHHLRERLTRAKSVASGLSWAASSQPIRRADPAASASISHAPPTDATGGRGASCHKKHQMFECVFCYLHAQSGQIAVAQSERRQRLQMLAVVHGLMMDTLDIPETSTTQLRFDYTDL